MNVDVNIKLFISLRWCNSMKITMDMHGYQSEDSYNRGRGRYSLYLAKAICNILGPNDEVVCLLNNNYKKEIVNFKKEFPNSSVDYFHTPLPRNIYGMDCSRDISRVMLDNKYDALAADVNFVLSTFEGYSGKTIVSHKFGNNEDVISAIVLYDLIPFIFSDRYLQDKNYKKWYLDMLDDIKKVDIIFAISEATRQDAIKYLGICPDKIVNILGSVDDKFKVINLSNKNSLRNKFDIHEKFLMYTGGIDYRKNIEGLIIAFSKLDKEIIDNTQLVIVCSVDDASKIRLKKLAKINGLADDRVVFTGFISDDDLVGLYNICDLFIFPSKYEGLGMPIIEAMKCGAPVIGANNSSIAEIIENRDALFDVDNIDDMVEVISRGLTNVKFVSELQKYSLHRAKDFDWNKSANIVVETLRKAILQRKANKDNEIKRHDIKRNIAFLSPLPPDKSGISNYSLELLYGLRKYFNIDLYSDIESSNYDFINDEFTLYKYEQLPEFIDRYDTIVYQMGNSDFHEVMYDYIQKYPGILVQHDFFISGMLQYVSYLKNKDYFFNSLIYCHGINKLREFFKEGDTECTWRYPMNKIMLDNARGIIYHSDYSYELYRKFYGCNYLCPNKKINQMRAKVDKRLSNKDAKKILNLSEDDFIITSFGFIAETKLSHIVAEGFIKFIKRCNNLNCKLIFVGDVVGDYKLKMDEVIQGREDIIITRYIDDEVFNHYLEASDVSVQLRTKSRGEVSRAVLDCFAYGIPVIVNSYATFNDYNDDELIKVSTNPSPDEIANSLFRLYSDEVLRKHYSLRGLEKIEQDHNVDKIAKEYADFINMVIDKNKYNDLSKFIEYVAQEIKRTKGDDSLIREIAVAYQKNNIPYFRKRIFSMCSELTLNDGIENYLYNKQIDVVNVELRGMDVHPTDVGCPEDFVLPIDDGDSIIVSANDVDDNILSLVQSYRLNLFIYMNNESDIEKINIVGDYIRAVISDISRISINCEQIIVADYSLGKIEEYL